MKRKTSKTKGTSQVKKISPKPVQCAKKGKARKPKQLTVKLSKTDTRYGWRGRDKGLAKTSKKKSKCSGGG